MHRPSHDDNEIDINKHIHNSDSNTNTSKNGTDVPNFYGPTSSILSHQDFQIIHWDSSGDNQNEIWNQKSPTPIFEAKVGKSMGEKRS